MRKLASAAFRTGSGSAGALAFGAIAIKTLALLLGPPGVGLFSLLRQTQQTLSLLGSFGGQTALVQGIASREQDDKRNFILTATVFFVAGATLVTLALLTLAPLIAHTLLDDTSANAINMVRWLALPSVAGIATAFFTGVLNGHKAINAVSWIQVVAGLGAACAAYPLAKLVRPDMSIPLVLILTISLAASAVYGLIICLRNQWLALPSCFSNLWHPHSARAFSTVGGTTLATSLIATISVLVIRALVLRRANLDAVGIFDVAWTLSMMYVMLILNSFNTYYLPTLSAASGEDRLKHIQDTLRFSTFCMVPLIAIVIVSKPLLVHMLYSKQFAPSLIMIRWMLLGDYLKITSWVLAVPMLAFADMKSLFWSELLANSFLIAGSAFALTTSYGLEGVGMSFLVLYVLYLIFTILYLKVRHGFRWEGWFLVFWFAGFCLLWLVSRIFWNDFEFRWRTAAPALLFVLAFDALGILLFRRRPQ